MNDIDPQLTLRARIIDVRGYPELDHDFDHVLEVDAEDHPLGLVVDNRFGADVVLTLTYPGGVARGAELGFFPGSGIWMLVPNQELEAVRTVRGGARPVKIDWRDRWVDRRGEGVAGSPVALACSTHARDKLRPSLSATIGAGQTLSFALQPAEAGYSRDFSLAVFEADRSRHAWPMFSMRTRKRASETPEPRAETRGPGLVLFRSLRS